MAQEVSPSEYAKITSSGKTTDQHNNYLKLALIVAVAIILCGISFMLGEHYQKSHTKGANSAAAGQGGRFGGLGGGFGGNRQRPSFGQVTAVSSSSITINNSRTGNSQTFTINSSTSVISNGASTAVSDIKTGDTVFIQTSSSDTSTATRIILNPTVQAPAQPGGSGSTST